MESPQVRIARAELEIAKLRAAYAEEARRVLAVLDRDGDANEGAFHAVSLEAAVKAQEVVIAEAKLDLELGRFGSLK